MQSLTGTMIHTIRVYTHILHIAYVLVPPLTDKTRPILSRLDPLELLVTSPLSFPHINQKRNSVPLSSDSSADESFEELPKKLRQCHGSVVSIGGGSFGGIMLSDLEVKATSASPSRPTGSLTRVQQKFETTHSLKKVYGVDRSSFGGHLGVGPLFARVPILKHHHKWYWARRARAIPDLWSHNPIQI
jgi:hypothetical protein